MVNQIYPPALQLDKANNSDTEAPFLDLHLTISNDYISSKRTSFNKRVFPGPEYLNTILGTNSHMNGICIAANFESNGPLVWCLLRIKSGWSISIPVIPEVIN